MDRKKTIIIAVMINAGLLIVLFIGAITRQEEGIRGESTPIAVLNRPLFSDEADFALQKQTTVQIPLDMTVTTPVVEMPKEEILPLHKLPAVANGPLTQEQPV